MHVSKQRQLERLYERLVNPLKHRKHKDSDRETRRDRDKYTKVYEDIFEKCNLTPWHIVPADQNRYKSRVLVNILLDKFKKLDLHYPPLVSKFPEKVLEAKERREKKQTAKILKDEKKKKEAEKKAQKEEAKKAKKIAKQEAKKKKEEEKKAKKIAKQKMKEEAIQAIDKTIASLTQAATKTKTPTKKVVAKH